MTPAKKVMERGHWFVTVRPMPYREVRVGEFVELESILHRSAVRLRGWDYPHISNRSEIGRRATFIEQGTDWQHYVEYWRFYKSGQLAFWQGISDDWRDQSTLWPGPPPEEGTVLGVLDAVYTMRELFTFAGHLALSPAGSDQMSIDAKLVNTQGRQLRVDQSRRAGFSGPRRCEVEPLQLGGQFDQETLASSADELAVVWSRELFSYFHWDPSTDLLEDLLAETRRA